MDACLLVCVCVLKGPCGVGKSGLISRHLVFARIPLSHAVSDCLPLFLSLFFARLLSFTLIPRGNICSSNITQAGAVLNDEEKKVCEILWRSQFDATHYKE